MQQYLGLTIATFLAFFILVSHGLPTTNTYLNKRDGLGDLGDLDLDLGLDLDELT